MVITPQTVVAVHGKECQLPPEVFEADDELWSKRFQRAGSRENSFMRYARGVYVRVNVQPIEVDHPVHVYCSECCAVSLCRPLEALFNVRKL